MANGLLPEAQPAPTQPQDVVETFLSALAAGDLPTAGALLADDVVYANVGLPTIHGRRRALKVLAPLSDRLRFEVYLHAVSADGPVVLTERTDVLVWGPLRLQFWVWGRFDVRDGVITLWRDSFDFLDTTKAIVRGLLGVAVPSLRPRPPSRPGVAPGRH